MCLFEQMPEERQLLGWDTRKPDYKWILGPPTTREDVEEMFGKVMEADVAVMGSCPQEIQAARSASGKLTLFMGERIWKQPHHAWRMLNPRYASGVRRFKAIANRTNVHYLAMGAYAAEDVARIGAYGDRIWAWPYFAEVNPSPPTPRNNRGVRMLWVGRMLDWKQVDVILHAVHSFGKDERFSGLDIVGTGPERSRLIKLARRLSLGEKVVFHEPMRPLEIREMMRRADIYVLASNRGEGWGVVANEAMSEGCVLVANEQAGASKELIQHGKTGFLYRNHSSRELADILRVLIDEPDLLEYVRQTAWDHLNRLWHPRVGAERLIALSSGLLGLTPLPKYEEGPCRRLRTPAI
jgi:glycosyltransferase involved in cell wall biosynthesis